MESAPWPACYNRFDPTAGRVRMSLTHHPVRVARLFRSELAVPGSQPRLFEKAARSAADAVYLDLEDAVAPDDKSAARANVVDALNGIDWGSKTVEVRVNGLDTAWTFRDVIEVVGRCPRLDLLIVPKVCVPADLYAVDMLLEEVGAQDFEHRRHRFPAGYLEFVVWGPAWLDALQRIAAGGDGRAPDGPDDRANTPSAEITGETEDAA